MPAGEGSFERFLVDLQNDVGDAILSALRRGGGGAAGEGNGSVGGTGIGLGGTESFDPRASFSFFRMHRFDPALGRQEEVAAAAGVPAPVVATGVPVAVGEGGVEVEGVGGERHEAGSAVPSPAMPPPPPPVPAPAPAAQNRPPLIPMVLVGVRSAPHAPSSTTSSPTLDAERASARGLPQLPGPRREASVGSMSTALEEQGDEEREGFEVGDEEREREREREEEEEERWMGLEDEDEEDEERGGEASETDTLADDLASETSSSRSQPPSTTDSHSRSWLIFVLAGIYPASHPIFTAPALFVPGNVPGLAGPGGSLDYETLLRLAELLGQHKPPVTSKGDLEASGLRVVKGKERRGMLGRGEVLENTVERCLICLEDYEDEEDLRLLKCRHVFHRDCIDQWLTTGRNSCPTCRGQGVKAAAAAAAAPAVGHAVPAMGTTSTSPIRPATTTATITSPPASPNGSAPPSWM